MSEPTTPQETAAKGTAVMLRQAANLSPDKWTDERLAAIRSAVAPKGASIAELAIFLATANKYDLDPLVGEIWLVKDERSGKMMVIVGRDCFIKVANREKDFEGFYSGVIYEKDGFTAERQGGNVLVSHSTASFNRGKIVGAYAVAHRRGFPDVFIAREIKEYSHLSSKKNWRDNPADMLETRCITAALKRLYNLAGLNDPGYEAELLDPTPEGLSRGQEGETAKSGTQETLAKLREQLALKGKPAADIDGVVIVGVDEPEVFSQEEILAEDRRIAALDAEREGPMREPGED